MTRRRTHRRHPLPAPGACHSSVGMGRIPNFSCIRRATSPGSACRPTAFLLKITTSLASTSKRPPLEGINFSVRSEGVKRESSSPVKLRARGV